MSTLRSRNPFLNAEAFQPVRGLGTLDQDVARTDRMTVEGAALASLLLLAVCTGSAILSWIYLPSIPGFLMIATVVASLLGCVLVAVCSFARKASPFLAVPIALCEGVFAGGASVFWSTYAARHGGSVAALGTGLVLQASILTFGIAACLGIAYSTRLFRVGNTFRMATVAATGGIALVSLLSLVLSLFGVHIPYLWENGIIGISFSGFVVVVAAMNLAMDFDFIESGAAGGLPRHMNWFAEIGLLVTLVWLYVSILRLLAQLSNRR